MKVSIVDYGAGNVQSLDFALNRLGVNGILTAEKEIIMNFVASTKCLKHINQI